MANGDLFCPGSYVEFVTLESVGSLDGLRYLLISFDSFIIKAAGILALEQARKITCSIEKARSRAVASWSLSVWAMIYCPLVMEWNLTLIIIIAVMILGAGERLSADGWLGPFPSEKPAR